VSASRREALLAACVVAPPRKRSCLEESSPKQKKPLIGWRANGEQRRTMTINGRRRTVQALSMYFLTSAGALLAAAGLGKLSAVSSPARILDAPEPVFGITFRQLLLLVGLGELLIAYLCFFTDKRQLSSVAVAWISTNFLVYRLGTWFTGWQAPCHCMGSLADVLHIAPRTADNMMKAVLVYLLLGSYAMLFWVRRRGRLEASARPTSAALG
jgi:hypothetical protein